jgi:UDP-N-acetylmuramyl pentapeptide phosphotransferase/UDP-N-acetylglucosamine-1-phosphate transferase
VSDLLLLLLLVTAATAALLSYGGIAGSIGWLKQRALAKPNERSSHSVPTPQAGGIIVVPVALLAAGAALAASGADLPGGMFHWAIVCAAALALTAIGCIDDMRGLSVRFRLGSQVVAVVVAVTLMPADLRMLPEVIPLPAERAALIAAALWFVNLFNFMDGIDLISVVETVAITLGIAILAAFGMIPAAYGIIAVALLGAMVGFAPWNSPPARLFLGDAGSIPIGFLLAILLIHLGAAGGLAAAVILPLYYLADATLTLVRRFMRGERVWEAHRAHFYQQATRNGLTVVETVGRIAVLDAVLIALAVGSVLHGRLWAGFAGLIAAAAVGATLRTFARGKQQDAP